MDKYAIINKIGGKYLKSNLEQLGEFSYKRELQHNFPSNCKHYKVDLRFVKDNLSIIFELKGNSNRDFARNEIEQIETYKKLEKKLTNNNIIAILYNIDNENMKVWKNESLLSNETTINSMDYYSNLFESIKSNDKNKVIETTNVLNEKLHSFGIYEYQRSQFVGSLLVALNNKLQYANNLTTFEIINRIKEILKSRIDNDENKALKTKLLIDNLDKQNIKELDSNNLIWLLDTIKKELIPFIDNKTSQGEDLLNLFFTTFNKYVGKNDKNQAYTPTHITDFMCEITNLSKESRVLDPTCGSGSFLVQAMSKMLRKAGNDEEKRKNIKKNQIFGIEKEEKAFGLATTNMLIHEDGKSNIVCDSCFDRKEWIKNNDINIVLMNPPFNGQGMPDKQMVSKKNVDSTKGFYFVYEIANYVNKGMLATILPLQCAIGSDKVISKMKKDMMAKHTLKAVFSLPDDIFYPGASVNTCIMLFELGVPHDSTKKTFFGYYKNDGFSKKKNKGRVEKYSWEKTKDLWLKSFYELKEIAGLSVLKAINYDDEWLAEAYMETDYEVLSENNFIQTIRDFIAYKVKNGDIDGRN